MQSNESNYHQPSDTSNPEAFGGPGGLEAGTRTHISWLPLPASQTASENTSYYAKNNIKTQ